MDNTIADLINTYHDLNAAVVDSLDEEPTPLEFMRYVAKNRPFVVRGAARSWEALQRWDADYLSRRMENDAVKVAVTPRGWVPPSYGEAGILNGA